LHCIRIKIYDRHWWWWRRRTEISNAQLTETLLEWHAQWQRTVALWKWIVFVKCLKSLRDHTRWHIKVVGCYDWGMKESRWLVSSSDWSLQCKAEMCEVSSLCLVSVTFARCTVPPVHNALHSSSLYIIHWYYCKNNSWPCSSPGVLFPKGRKCVICTVSCMTGGTTIEAIHEMLCRMYECQ